MIDPVHPLKPPILRAAMLLVCSVIAWFLTVAPGKADLRVCNQTANRAGVTIGYQDGSTWVTEGWFNLKGNGCEIILKGKLNSRYYYIFAVDYDRGGEWSGPNYLCTRDAEFSIRGPQDCYARGFERSGFLEIDTAEQADWTVELAEGGQVGGQIGGPAGGTFGGQPALPAPSLPTTSAPAPQATPKNGTTPAPAGK